MCMQRFFTAAATRIQRTWRGWFSRKHRHDFYKRQSYLEGVRHANAVVRKLTAQQADLSWRCVQALLLPENSWDCS